MISVLAEAVGALVVDRAALIAAAAATPQRICIYSLTELLT